MIFLYYIKTKAYLSRHSEHKPRSFGATVLPSEAPCQPEMYRDKAKGSYGGRESPGQNSYLNVSIAGFEEVLQVLARVGNNRDKDNSNSGK